MVIILKSKCVFVPQYCNEIIWKIAQGKQRYSYGFEDVTIILWIFKFQVFPEISYFLNFECNFCNGSNEVIT